MPLPLLSVIMPFKNAAEYIAEAIESILGQTFTDFEFIVVDDDSTDDSCAICEHYAAKDSRVKIVKNLLDAGIVGALNFGISQARGQFIARMDADDISLPHRFARQLAYLEKYPEVDLCGSWMRVFGDANIVSLPPDQHNEIVCQLLLGCSISHPTYMWRRERLRSLEPDFYKSRAQHAEDYELLLRLSTHYVLGNVAEVLLLYRLHQKNVGQVHTKKQQEMAAQLRREAVEKMGILHNDEVMLTHNLIATGDYRKINGVSAYKNFFIAAKKWAAKLSAANTITRRYEQKALEKFLDIKIKKIKRQGFLIVLLPKSPKNPLYIIAKYGYRGALYVYQRAHYSYKRVALVILRNF